VDLATILGIITAFSLIVIAISTGGGLTLFINIPSVLIVVGGTLGATLINYPLGRVLQTVGVVKNAFLYKTFDTGELIALLVDFAGKARRDGLLVLQSAVEDAKDPFLNKGIQMAIDGIEPQFIEKILNTETEFIEERHRIGAEIFITMGTFAPAFGLIGTLIGLVQMLQSMDDPSTIGPSMAVALLTTFYGAVMANVILMPIAGKLKTRSKEELIVKELTIEGIISIAGGDNPRIVEQKLHSFLAPRLRKSSFEK